MRRPFEAEGMTAGLQTESGDDGTGGGGCAALVAAGGFVVGQGRAWVGAGLAGATADAGRGVDAGAAVADGAEESEGDGALGSGTAGSGCSLDDAVRAEGMLD